ncbi:unnamed protein product [Symbiodinium natans]|uniref:Uncharacterized protein n=1 Tax=Symbiodinium natans TaxID=878477 RepID=A0A812I5U7_9DINO|nr:unnamed protein product [Symbiodinium natans]
MRDYHRAPGALLPNGRGLALEQANIFDYKLHDQLIEKYSEYRLMPTPPGFATVGMGQIEAADRRFFMLMAEKFLSMIQQAFGCCCQGSPSKKRRLGSKGRGKGKGKGRGERSAGGIVPVQLLRLGCVASTFRGNPVCF